MQSFVDYWDVSQDLPFLASYGPDQAPITGCVCCPSSPCVTVSSKKARYCRPEHQARVDGIGVAEVIASDLQTKYQMRSWDLLNEIRKSKPVWDLSGSARDYELPYYFVMDHVPPPVERLRALGYSEEDLDLFQMDPLELAGPISDLANAPIPVRVTRYTYFRSGKALHFRDWKKHYSGSTSIHPQGIDEDDFVVRAEDLRNGFSVLKHWLALGLKPSDAHRDLAEVCANWIYQGPYNGVRTGKTKVQMLKRRLHKPCAEHQKFVDSVFE
jgi:hypothetical protein